VVVFVTLVPKDMGEGLVPMLVALEVGDATYLQLAHLSTAITRDDVEMIRMLIHVARSKVNPK